VVNIQDESQVRGKMAESIVIFVHLVRELSGSWDCMKEMK
jgi:hypothetical protein